jgi:hypothetical protein
MNFNKSHCGLKSFIRRQTLVFMREIISLVLFYIKKKYEKDKV